jgi:predicted transcriptional regulator
MAETTTIRLPPKLRARLAAIAKQADCSVHSLILDAVEKHVAYEEKMSAFIKEARRGRRDRSHRRGISRRGRSCVGTATRERRGGAVSRALAKVIAHGDFAKIDLSPF